MRKLEQTSSSLIQHELFFLRTWNDISITIISPVCCTFPSFLRASFFSWLHIQVLYIEKRKNQMFINNMDDDCCGRNLRSLVVLTSRTERSISRQMNGFFFFEANTNLKCGLPRFILVHRLYVLKYHDEKWKRNHSILFDKLQRRWVQWLDGRPLTTDIRRHGNFFRPPPPKKKIRCDTLRAVT